MTSATPATAADLAATELLGPCAPDVLAQLQSVSRVRSLRRHQVLFAEGDPADSLAVVRVGRLKVYAASRSGDELLLAIAGPSDTLGEVGIIEAAERSATVEAMEPSEVILVPRGELIRALDADPALSRRLQIRISALTRKLTSASTDLAFVDLPRRLAKALLELGASGAGSALALSQSDLASLVGGSRQAVNAALAGFERRGWLTREAGRVVTLDRAALKRFVGD